MIGPKQNLTASLKFRILHVISVQNNYCNYNPYRWWGRESSKSPCIRKSCNSIERQMWKLWTTISMQKKSKRYLNTIILCELNFNSICFAYAKKCNPPVCHSCSKKAPPCFNSLAVIQNGLYRFCCTCIQCHVCDVPGSMMNGHIWNCSLQKDHQNADYEGWAGQRQ